MLIIKQVVNTEKCMTTSTACNHHSDCESEMLPAKFKDAHNHHIIASTHRSNLWMEFSLRYVDPKQHLTNTDNRKPNLTREMLKVHAGATGSSGNPRQL